MTAKMPGRAAREIPREAWSRELNLFTAAHEGWLVTLDVIGPPYGERRELASVPLLGVSADRSDHDGGIAISLARTPHEHVTHVIRGVARLYATHPNDGASAGLLIESDDGRWRLLQLTAPASLPVGA